LVWRWLNMLKVKYLLPLTRS